MGDFATLASQNGACISQEICHLMIWFHKYLMIKDESNKKDTRWPSVKI
jgi:hypothetical protein